MRTHRRPPQRTAVATGAGAGPAGAEGRSGPVGARVGDAFAGVLAPFADLTAAEFRRVTEVTYRGYVNGTRAAPHRMSPRDRGTVVQVGPAIAHRDIPPRSAHSSARHAVQGRYEALRREPLAADSGARVTAAQPPAVDTPQVDPVLSRLPARAVRYADHHPGRRESRVGASTTATRLADAVAPGPPDRRPARPEDRPRPVADPDALPMPVDDTADHGPRGRFHDGAHAHSPQLCASRQHGPLAAAGTAPARGSRRSAP
ncbi:SDR family NAD(P)-dependent oxidoreductase [Kitasatospora sp. NPDC056184]|uniref:SDR family NAD(P)-dependent oxidoreductase n=1 Tax=Kitasatospora sp. NPDC056184 TaxID=3345738 RepID=UPI0035E11936